MFCFWTLKKIETSDSFVAGRLHTIAPWGKNIWMICIHTWMELMKKRWPLDPIFLGELPWISSYIIIMQLITWGFSVATTFLLALLSFVVLKCMYQPFSCAVIMMSPTQYMVETTNSQSFGVRSFPFVNGSNGEPMGCFWTWFDTTPGHFKMTLMAHCRFLHILLTQNETSRRVADYFKANLFSKVLVFSFWGSRCNVQNAPMNQEIPLS